MSLPLGCQEPLEMLAWGLLLTEPPMASYKDLIDGTYDIDDILQMNILVRYKNELLEDARNKKESKK